MPEVKNLYIAALGIHAIVDIQRRMEKPPDAWMPFHRSANIGKDLQGIEVIEKSVSELLRVAWMLPARPIKDLFQVR